MEMGVSKNSRTVNTMKNVATELVFYLISTPMVFITRKVFIVTLGNEYLSVNGLFTEVLSVLALAEAGFGSAVIFSLYKPLEECDEGKINALMELYKKAYRLIAAVVFILGLCIMPFLNYIIKDKPDISQSIYIIFLMYLLNSVMSYFFAYKRSILIAGQKSYVVARVNSIASIALMIMQVTVLWITQNFIIYFAVTILSNLVTNYIISKFAEFYYPVIKKKAIQELDKETTDTIKTNIKSILLYRIGYLLTNGIDNIIISSFVGLEFVGIYSNYFLITTKVTSLIDAAFAATTGSVGSLNATDDSQKKDKIYRVMLFIASWLFGFSGIAFFVLLDSFIKLCFGDYFVFPTIISGVIALNAFLGGMYQPSKIFRETMGLYRYGKYRPIMGAIVNIIFSVALVKPLGVLGVLLGTLGSRVLVLSWYEPRINYKYGLKLSGKRFYFDYLRYIFTTLAVAGITWYLANFFTIEGLAGFVFKMVVVAIIPNFLFICCYFKTEYFTYLKEIVFVYTERFIGHRRKSIK